MSAPTAPRRGGPALVMPPPAPALWAIAAVGLAALVGAAVATDHAYVPLNVGLVLAAALFVARWPLASLLVLLAIVPKASSSPVSFFVVIALAGSVVALAWRLDRVPLPVVTGAWLLLLVVAAIKLPWQPVAGQMPYLPLPVLGTKWLPSMSAQAALWLRLCFLFASFVLATWSVRDALWIRRAFAVSVAVSAWPIFVGLEQFAGGELVASGGQTGRSTYKAVESLFVHPNGFAIYLVVVIGLTIVMLMQARATLARIGLIALLGSAGFCLYHTYTRAAWIAAAGVFIVLGVWRWRVLLVVGLVGLVIATLAFPAATRAVQARFGDLSSRSASHASNSWDWRTGQWERLIPYGSREPLLGNGFGSYERLTVEEFGLQDPTYPTPTDGPGRGFAAHNDYVRMYVELGVPGLVLWTTVLAGLLVAMARRARDPELGPYAAALAAILLALMVMSFSDNVLNYMVALFYPVALAGAVIGATRPASAATSAAKRAARPADQAMASPAGAG
jgi:O-antigen ligase